ncbi:hypothetical protein KIW84_052681 [Lathyrus oleraceus]|uniref:Uncharacterized protein n=1 Tax=Pisum sativum TaxID=3888 RepID=A0A9D4WSD8_PEA|nr:hypothetical protein KIW84_052681 [Pisum sativum]
MTFPETLIKILAAHCVLTLTSIPKKNKQHNGISNNWNSGRTVTLPIAVEASTYHSQNATAGLWIMAAVSKSNIPSRNETAAVIMQDARNGFNLGGNNANDLLAQFAGSVDHLCFHVD